jgi:hypothetical protein
MRLWESFQVANRLKQINHWVQVILIISFLFGLNYLALNHFVRHDLTRDHRFALSPETRAYLAELREPVRIVVTIPENSPRSEEVTLFRYTSQLLQEYAYLSRRDGQFQISVEFVDIYKELARAEVLSREFGLDQVNAVLVASDHRKRLIRPDELVRFVDRDPVAFTGEAALTSAIIEVTQQKAPRLYFLRGHRETPPDDTSPSTGLSEISRELQLRNVSLLPIDLTAVDTVPEDASAIVIADPRGPLRPSEVEKIRSYLIDRAGRAIIWLRPGVETGMDTFLAEWGIHLPPQSVIEPDPAFRESSGTLIIRNFVPHPVTDSLIQNQTSILLGNPRPVIPIRPSPPDERLRNTPLFASSNRSWGESSQLASEATFSPDSDRAGPVPIAVVAERKASSQLGIEVPGGRLVVFGSPDLFSNQRVASLGNASLFFNTLNWMLDRDRMLAIPPRAVETYRIPVSQAQLRQIALLFLLVPGSLALLGFFISWIRKS